LPNLFLTHFQILGVSRSKLLQAVASRNHTIHIHGNEGTISLQPHIMQAIAWISRYAEQIADYCPRSGKLFIPHCYTRTDLWRVYIDEMRVTPNTTTVVKLAWFSRLLKIRFPHLHLASRLMLGFCDECVRLTEARLKASNEEEKTAFKRAQTLHFELQRAERVSYHRRKLQASSDPHSYWSVIIDYTER
jgi:hypothetical protein